MANGTLLSEYGTVLLASQPEKNAVQPEPNLTVIFIIVGFFILLAMLGRLYFKKNKKTPNKRAASNPAVSVRNRSEEEQTAPETTTKTDPTAEEKLFQDLKRQADELELEMMHLIGGKTGMIMLRENFRHPVNEESAYNNKKGFQMRQERLKKLYREYFTVKAQAEKLEKLYGHSEMRIIPMNEDAFYEDLLKPEE